MNLLFDSALKATLILFAAWTASLALRRASADVRHNIWLAAMLAVAILPAALSIPQSALPSAARFVFPAIATGSRVAAPGTPWLVMIWAAGAGIVLVRLILGILAAARITRSAHNLDGNLYSERASTPMTWGLIRPVVILPAYGTAWTEGQRDLVLRHERAHIARRDWLWQMIASVVTAVFWFHPLMWLAKIELRREAEGAADDRVLGAGASPSDYAGRLLDVARRMHGRSALSAVIPMVRKPELETRVQSILDPSRRRVAAGVLLRCAIAAAAVALIIPIAVTRQRAYAQGRVYRIGDGVTAPRIVYKQEPEYTPEAKEEKIQGTVVLRVEIAATGYAENIQVTQSLDPGLDQKAVDAVLNWKFKPGTKDGQPVAVYATIEVTFRLL